MLLYLLGMSLDWPSQSIYGLRLHRPLYGCLYWNPSLAECRLASRLWLKMSEAGFELDVLVACGLEDTKKVEKDRIEGRKGGKRERVCLKPK